MSESQSVKTTASGRLQGCDAGKINSRKRHILTETIGPPVGMIAHPAGIQDLDGGPTRLARTGSSFSCLRHIFADDGYAGDKLQDALKDLEIERSRSSRGSMLPRDCPAATALGG